LKPNSNDQNKEEELEKGKRVSLGLMAGLLITSLLFMGGCLPTGLEGEEGQGDLLTSVWPMLIFLVLIFGLMYFVMIRPQRKRQQEHQNLIEELHKGDRVMTAGGIYGQIESVSEDSAVLKVESGATMRIAKTSIIGKQEQGEAKIS